MPKIHRIITAEMNVFMAGSIAVFPRYGKFFRPFSTPWKIRAGFFHSVEKSFPHCGKLFPGTGWNKPYLAPPTSNG